MLDHQGRTGKFHEPTRNRRGAENTAALTQELDHLADDPYTGKYEATANDEPIPVLGSLYVSEPEQGNEDEIALVSQYLELHGFSSVAGDVLFAYFGNRTADAVTYALQGTFQEDSAPYSAMPQLQQNGRFSPAKGLAALVAFAERNLETNNDISELFDQEVGRSSVFANDGYHSPSAFITGEHRVASVDGAKRRDLDGIHHVPPAGFPSGGYESRQFQEDLGVTAENDAERLGNEMNFDLVDRIYQKEMKLD